MNTSPENENDIEILVVEDSATQARQLAQLLAQAATVCASPSTGARAWRRPDGVRQH